MSLRIVNKKNLRSKTIPIRRIFQESKQKSVPWIHLEMMDSPEGCNFNSRAFYCLFFFYFFNTKILPRFEINAVRNAPRFNSEYILYYIFKILKTLLESLLKSKMSFISFTKSECAGHYNFTFWNKVIDSKKSILMSLDEAKLFRYKISSRNQIRCKCH